ncbi:MAG: biotin/lipoate A/B protein ligase family protein [Acidobacteriota bacterium]
MPSFTPSPWRLLRDQPLAGPENMARDRALLDVMEEQLAAGESPAPILRFYDWSPPTLSFGRGQKIEQAADLEACRREGVDLVRRPTGGRGVLHDQELTFGVIAPATGPLAGTGVSRAAAALAAALADGLCRLGVPAAIARGLPGLAHRERRGACFGSTSREELTVDGRKLCGAAQFRGRGALLEHGSLPFVFDVERQARVLGADPGVLTTKAMGLADCLTRVPDRDEVEAALSAGFETELAARLEPSELTERETEVTLQRAAALREDTASWRPAAQPCAS